MGSIEAPPLTVVQPGAGAAGHLGTIGVAFKLWGHDTGGAISIVEHPFPVGALVPPHLHTREDVLGAGGYITKPRGELHTMWNAGKAPARMIEVISPAGFENFFREMADMVASGPPQFPDVTALAEKYGLRFGRPDWLPDLISRYDLTPPPGA